MMISQMVATIIMTDIIVPMTVVDVTVGFGVTIGEGASVTDGAPVLTTETVLLTSFVTYVYAPFGVTATPNGPAPTCVVTTTVFVAILITGRRVAVGVCNVGRCAVG